MELKNAQSGAVEVEIAVGLTLLIILTMGGFDVGRYILLSQKLDRTVMSTGDLLARGALPDAAGTADIFEAVPFLVQPFGFGDNGKVVLSAVSEDLNGDPTVVWQRDSGGDMEADSLLGVQGEEATLPEGLQTLPNENIIVAELFYDYRPVFGMGLTEARRLYHRSFYRTRIE
ncbi:TadE/TadG family type IV pilus assembly protein [Rhodovibrionaceae bacterium A322]